ncbi:MAG: NUDIX domain-containing protein [Anaerolineae bacterium]|nr:NUDIX domain-containing protein [Anaerolineae bacterium]
MWCEPTVLVYALHDGEVLLMHRKQEPNLGLWIAPGGKLDPGESPYEAARREFAEETGLEAQDLKLRGFCTLIPLLKQYPWFIFIFVTTDFRGTLTADCAEGDLTWVPLDTYFTTLPKPGADAIFAPEILTATDGLFQAKFVYDAENKLVEWIEHS